MHSDTELDVFKREIDLRQFAASLGYAMDRRESRRGSTVLRRGGDKIVVKRNRNGHYVFFSVRDDSDHGTIIDFLQRRRHVTLGAVRQTLRPWIGQPVAAVPLFPKLPPTSPDRVQVETAYRRMANALRQPYLEQVRGVPATLLGAPRFAGRVRIDRRGNAVFPHFDGAGMCGYEIKNQRFTGFAAGGHKGLWLSHCRPQDRRLVLAESAIDALSYAALFPDAEDQTRYASLGGKPNSKQPALVQAIIARLPERSEIVAAFDTDEAGRRLVDMLRLAVAGVAATSGRTDLIFRAHLPAQEGHDWNQILQIDNAETFQSGSLSRIRLDQNWGCRHHGGRGKTNSCPGWRPLVGFEVIPEEHMARLHSIRIVIIILLPGLGQCQERRLHYFSGAVVRTQAVIEAGDQSATGQSDRGLLSVVQSSQSRVGIGDTAHNQAAIVTPRQRHRARLHTCSMGYWRTTRFCGSVNITRIPMGSRASSHLLGYLRAATIRVELAHG
jgi:hypothetical protein